jgi:hypothetical protein
MADGTDSTSKTDLQARTVASLTHIERDTWNALANPPGQPYHPFVDYDFLEALEASGSVTPETGWAPHHLLLEKAGQVIGAAPMYAKGHSQGEYIFDHAWADAYERAGGRYYPKLLIAVPFTPATGPRLLARDAETRTFLAHAAAQVSQQSGVSSLHINFMQEKDTPVLGELGYLKRIGQQFHFQNPGYDSFDEFLASLASRKRKNLRKERAAAVKDVEVEWLTGSGITEAHLDAFWVFYQDTGARKWGMPYLTRPFFSLLIERMAERVLLIIARKDGEYVAGALNMIGGNTLYGRYWGCTEHIPFLHFELCYYQAIDYAIQHKLKSVEAGAQGEHKIARGYVPVPTCSMHWLPDPGFRSAVERFLHSERQHMAEEIEFLKDYTPFRKS